MSIEESPPLGRSCLRKDGVVMSDVDSVNMFMVLSDKKLQPAYACI